MSSTTIKYKNNYKKKADFHLPFLFKIKTTIRRLNQGKAHNYLNR